MMGQVFSGIPGGSLGAMFVRLLIVTLAFALAGCGMVERTFSFGGAKPPPANLRLPVSVSVDDGRNGTMPMQMAALVDGGGLNATFGSRGYSMGGNGSPRHDGIDILAPQGAAIHAASDGRIVDLGWRGNYGRFILIRHSDRLETAYAHLSRYAEQMAVGQTVRRNEVIGYVGTSGNATGAHLHFEVRRDGRAVDPLSVSAAQIDIAR
jgi:murein DD-endopeptidase MepM/ murein hydrolase activator NlpD